MTSARRRLPVVVSSAAALLIGAALLAPARAGAAEEAAEEPSGPRVLGTVYDDRRAGDEAAQQVAAEIGLVDDPKLSELVERVGQRLARHAPGYRFEYRFRVADQDVPNAFALPGGFIYVTRGLLALTNSEDELAGVLAHEIVHVASRHAAGREQLVRDVPSLLQWFQMGNLSAYGRNQERTADRLGQGLAGLAGYDPEGLPSFLSSLDFNERIERGGSRLPGFLDTHPTTSERVAEAGQRAGLIAWTRRPGEAGEGSAYLRRLDGLVVGPSAAEGVFRGARFLHPELAFTLRFPEGWELQNTRRAVGARAPRRDAQVYLEHQGEGTDPEQAAAEWLEKQSGKGFRLASAEPLRLVGRPAWRVTGRAPSAGGSLWVVLTWIPHRAAIYRLTGVSASGTFRRHEGTLIAVARSFRPLSRELLSSVQESRMRLVEARQGESLAELAARSGNDWGLQRTAVMNQVFASEPLRAGQLVKVSVAQSYRPSGPGQPGLASGEALP